MRTRRTILGLALTAGLLAATGRATDAGDAAGPVLRPLTTDRPDVTESPFTVDPGHVQLEFDVANYTGDRADGRRTEEWGVLPFNLRLGLLRDLEAGIFVAPYAHRTDSPPGAGPPATTAGFGDVTLRGKLNFWGNDGGETAGGLILDLTVPTAARGLGSGKTTGTVLLPVQFDLGGGWDLSAMTATEFRPGEAGGTRTVWTNTASLGHELGLEVSGYVELTSAVGDGPHVATGDVGLAYKLNSDTQLDLGANFGLTRRADDVVVFAGVSRRY